MKLCMGCMNQIEDNENTCPLCGFNETTLRQESYYLKPGTIIGGKYIVGKVLAYGGVAISYLGMDAEFNKKVVVKEYLPNDFSTRSEGEKEITIYSGDAQAQFEQGLSNFLNESSRIQNMGKLEGVATVYDCVAENDTGYVISEYVEGQTIKDILATGKKYDVLEAKAIIMQMLKGLSKLHPQDVIHCDISPENVVISNTGEVKLLNFGATRYITTANSKSLAIILKQGYAPEEQYRSKGVRGPWTDVYAVGAVMYKMITGITPMESVERTLEDELKTPSKLGIKITENVENALMNALNVFQEERTQNASAFLKELSSPSVKRIKSKKVRKETGKFPAWAKALVACLLVLVVGGGVFLYNKMGETNNLSTEQKGVKDYTGYDYAKAKKELEVAGYTVKLYKQYDSNEAYNNTISNQDINEGKKVAKLYYSQNETISFKELSELDYNAYNLAQKIDKNIEDDLFVIEDSNNSASGIFEISCVKVAGKEYSIDDLEKQKEDAESGIKISEIESILYYNKFCIFNDFVKDAYIGKSIEAEEVTLYEKKNQKTGEKEIGKAPIKQITTLYDDSYYSFEYGEGYICRVDADEDVSRIDTSSNEFLQRETKLFCVVGEKKAFKSNNYKSGGDLKKALIDAGFPEDKIVIKGDGETYAISGEIQISEGYSLACFDEKATITITTKKPEVKSPEKNNSSGISNGNSSVGGNTSGSGSTNGGQDTTQAPADTQESTQQPATLEDTFD